MSENLVFARRCLAAVVHGKTLSVDEAYALMRSMASGSVPPEMVGGLLAALAVRGETSAEIAGFARAMRDLATPVPCGRKGSVDTCGTGGDGGGTLNISTTAALLAAAAGVPVVKHGNRAISSRCGSADVLEALGIPFPKTPAEALHQWETTRFTFLFAPYYHPAMKTVAPVRRNLQIRTVFNILGPLVNPARVRRQVLGVFSAPLMETLTPVFGHLGHERVILVHHEQGLDEALSIGRTHAVIVNHGETRSFDIRPESFGFAPGSLDALAGGTPEANAAAIRGLFERPDATPRVVRETAILNAGLALYASGTATDLETGLARAEEALTRGAARELLDRLQRPLAENPET